MEEDQEHPLQGPKLPPRNPQTHAAHRRSFFWQVALPFFIFVLIFLGMAVGVGAAAASGSGSLRRWADVAILWQLPLPIFLSLLCLIVNLAMLYGLLRLIGVLPGAARQVHSYVLLAQSKVNALADRLVSPFIAIRVANAKIRAARRALTGKPPPSRDL